MKKKVKVTASELYDKIVNDYKLVGEKGYIEFSLKELSISVETRDSVGSLLQQWLKAWMEEQHIEFDWNPNTQSFPDFFLDVANKKKGLLEVKCFDLQRGPGFDLANFDSYCNSLLKCAYRIDSDYLVIGYKMDGSEITIGNIWLKKIWELSCPSGTYPVKVQEKKNVIYNLRPGTWYSNRAKFSPFPSIEEFLSALNETRYRYPQTRHLNAHWLNKVIQNYNEHTGVKLSVE